MQRGIFVVAFGALLVLAALAAGALAGAGAAMWVFDAQSSGALRVSGSGGVAVAELARAVAPGMSADDALLDAVRRTRPAVVTVWNLRHVRRTAFSSVELAPVGSGSGVIFDPRGYIATNGHVVDGAEAIEVVYLDGHRTSATLVKGDLGYDVAVLQVPTDGLPAVAPLADSSALEPGMRVLAIGSPLGTEYQNTVTSGIIAGLNRRVKQPRFDWNTLQYREVDAVGAPLIQTDAAINSGNSGGPLVNLQGEVVGLNTLIVRSDGNSTVEGLGFAIPSNVVRALADEWVDGVLRPSLGIEFETIDPIVARENGLSHSTGAIVMSVTGGSAAEAAGLRVGDIIVGIDGTVLNVDHALADQLWRYRAGDTVRLDVDRSGQPLNLEVRLGDG